MVPAVIFALFPVFWVVSTSFKTADESYTLPVHWLPQNPTNSNYAAAFASRYGVKSISNSLMVAVGGTLLALFTGYPAAYFISRHRTGKFALFVVPFIVRALPPIVFTIPLLVFYSSIGLVDTTQGLILVYGATTVFYIIWMTKPFIDAVPREIEEAATVDGVARWRLPFSVILPLVAGGLAAATIFAFILSWTEFTIALSLTRFEARTIPIQMTTLSALGAVSEGQGQAAALSTVSLVPFLAIAYYLQKQLLRTFFLGIVRR